MSPEENVVGGSVSGGSSGGSDVGSWAVRLTFSASPGEESWPVEVEGGFSTRGDAMLHGWFAEMYLSGFNLAGVAVGRLGDGRWAPLESARASKLARTEVPESDVYRPRPGDRVMDVRAGSWGRTGVVAFISQIATAPVVLVRPDDRGEEGWGLFECSAADVVWLPATEDVCAAHAGGPVAGRDLLVPGWVEAVQAASSGGRVVEKAVRRDVADIGAAVRWDLFDIVIVLKLARRDRGLTQGATAALLGVGESSVGSWETGDSTPSMPHLIGWARLLRLRLTILDGDGEEVDCVVLPRVPGEDRDTYEARRLAVILRERRKARRKLTQTDVAALAGVSLETVQRWERADKPVRTMGLLRWVRALGCTLGLLPDHDQPPHDRPDRPDQAA